MRIVLYLLVVVGLCSVFAVTTVFGADYPAARQAPGHHAQLLNPETLSPPADKRVDYTGYVRVYLVEPTSRWVDATGAEFGFGLLDFVIDTMVSIGYQESYIETKIWDASISGFDPITEDNIMAIAVVQDAEGHQSYSAPPTGNPFTAYYVDATVAATPAKSGYTDTREEYTHTVFIEEGTTTT